ncbi:hypothetical protein MWU54_03615 [Marivita sp. S6314]|uniref:papain-like cysteine protease family protein n=1 Tax=Marivita sp. S6314 TaxID=2926406 RepID=UPI001FF165E6|nr:papain-like cysteine protease family protein [Marivita sp. S6314]MCK0149097.1 hypothetical protein [Marivita sp. S6314]
MAEVKLNVPLIPQRLALSCWYASACMIGYYYEAGPRYGMPNVWQEGRIILFEEVATLARNEDMVFLQSATHDFTAASLIDTLSNYGPIWAGTLWKGYGHAVVITGCSTEGDDGGTVFYNDPEPVDVGGTATVSIKTFNTQRCRGYLLVRDPATI